MRIIDETSQDNQVIPNGGIVYCKHEDEPSEDFYGIYIMSALVIADLTSGETIGLTLQTPRIGDKYENWTITKKFDNIELRLKEGL